MASLIGCEIFTMTNTNLTYTEDDFTSIIALRAQYTGLIAGYSCCLGIYGNRPLPNFVNKDGTLKQDERYWERVGNLLKPLREFVSDAIKFEGLMREEIKRITDLTKRIESDSMSDYILKRM